MEEVGLLRRKHKPKLDESYGESSGHSKWLRLKRELLNGCDGTASRRVEKTRIEIRIEREGRNAEGEILH